MAGHLRDLVGKCFGRLTVLAFEGFHAHPSGGRSAKWICRCDCGTEKAIQGQALRNGSVQSCGCLQRERVRAVRTIHGATNRNADKRDRLLYGVWMTIKQRCYDESSCEYPNYGGRGITMCERWLKSFANFREDMGYPPPGCSIERIHNDGCYEPANCRWASSAEQNRNKRTNHWITFGGETMVVADWAKRLGCNSCVISRRLMLGWGEQDAVSVPVKHRKAKEAA